MKCFCFTIFVLFFTFKNFCESVQYEPFSFKSLRKLLSDTKHPIVANRTHNITKELKLIGNSLKDDESTAGTEAAVLFIVAIVVLSVIGMVIYFLRKFDQLNKSLPTYRYSSLKTEINGYGPDDKNESQCLVAVSTEEEEDYTDEDEISPPTLLVQSQTVMPTKSINGSISISQDNKSNAKSGESSLDSDDELLQ
ncbi:uncharacterized protein [Parasteatoda tepidariorum]|nr:uncharacterized protein LOC107441538 [Parasteatoda tepidariorum]